MLKDSEDAYGHALYDHFNGRGGYEITERDDGFFDVSLGPDLYFSEYETWSNREKEAIAHAEGRVLDIGCGAGRHSLYLQEHGHEVVGVDISPLAIRTCRLRGLRNAEVKSISEIGPELGIFDTIIMFGNNFGLLQGYEPAKAYLRKFSIMTSDTARILAESRDPYRTEVPEHLEYHEFNRKRGRMAGQMSLRVHYKKFVTPWFDYLIVSKEEMQDIVSGTGWVISRCFEESQGIYSVVIEKE
ncbi:MAG: class I SAM-dependent methyltransferase [Theionarchaea archaeon]|nr:class I SAM-dependent methyltransferase [Theionarchaea archaeon]MBU6999561.1 class I SAM-dependent methyltransferase [Theionarchaea archaeon]MBU7020275.1 class I SAM-dependent methyltransferase [Theionarchaea archaeon]MBU7035180.1 class I SAM-dependent methyltransferase [Theionarchaea archaeon]MBU7041493.1 class I SAM-dependent methyltransferase [Theionarchaea archaeon]